MSYPRGAFHALAAYGLVKTSEVRTGLNLRIPGTPLGVNIGEGDKIRLPGMTGWVPRETAERVFQGLEQGYDLDALLDQETSAGRVRQPTMGAIGGGLAARVLAPKAGASSMALGAGIGAALGETSRRQSIPAREKDVLDVLRGIAVERRLLEQA